MRHYILGSVLLLVILWFGNAQAGGPWSNQYCNLKTETVQIVDQSGNVVDSQTVETLICDDGVKDFLAYSGIAKDCREYYYTINLSGYPIRKKGFVCEKLDGSYEIVDPSVR